MVYQRKFEAQQGFSSLVSSFPAMIFSILLEYCSFLVDFYLLYPHFFQGFDLLGTPGKVGIQNLDPVSRKAGPKSRSFRRGGISRNAFLSIPGRLYIYIYTHM